jgi:hypothetical protein
LTEDRHDCLTDCKSAAGHHARAHKSMLPLIGLEEFEARAARRPTSACRLHLQVRPRPEPHCGLDDLPFLTDEIEAPTGVDKN